VLNFNIQYIQYRVSSSGVGAGDAGDAAASSSRFF